MNQDPIVIDVEGIGELEFPEGTDPAVIQATVKRLTGGGDAPAPVASHGEESQHPHAKVGRWVKENAPMVGGGLAALATSGASLPAQAIAAAGGGFLGSRLRGDDRGTAAKEGAIQGAVQGAAGLVPIALSALGRRMYQGALKPTKAVLSKMAGGGSDTQKIGRLVQTGMDEGVNVTKRGLDKSVERIGGLNDEIADAISSSTATVPRQAVSRRLAEPVQRFKNQVAPLDDLKQIAGVGKEFQKTNRINIPVQKAQAMKQGTYRALAGKYGGEVKSASAEAQKALGRGLKDEIAAAVPGVGTLNARESSLLSLKSALEDAMRRTGNRDLVGLTDVVAGATNPGWLAATMAMRAGPQSALGRGAYRTGQAIDPQALAAAVRALLAGSPHDPE